jgi:hypothetical protein
VLIAGGFSQEARAVGPTEIFDALRNEFLPGPELRDPRHSHTATRLTDGRVLIAGGMRGGDYLSSAELFDPVTGRVSGVASMREPRSGHQSVLLADGRVLLAGGVGTGWTLLATAELYDPRTEQFVPTGALALPRESHTATLLEDGDVLVTGGHGGRRGALALYASAERYHPRTGRWTSVGDMTVRRHKHDAARLPDGRVLITGGSDERDDVGAYRSAELYSPVTGRFEPAGQMHLPRWKHQGTTLVFPNGSVLLASGAATPERFDPTTRRFTLVPVDPPMRGAFAAAAVVGLDEALVAGGYGGGGGPSVQAWRVRAP